ncbi:hypothetical protein LOK49_LG14G00496 [Camellia lanceoleosa]|uniref:Uncharacterized protein n=1 Tax=Camellia lanceoleosa TaxID=1840588 RepID=A0ACC0F897_9ERIC|nr:hypothetical protein LOK49_LG14G00496 [Camellia lanceoleosa]
MKTLLTAAMEAEVADDGDREIEFKFIYWVSLRFSIAIFVIGFFILMAFQALNWIEFKFIYWVSLRFSIAIFVIVYF